MTLFEAQVKLLGTTADPVIIDTGVHHGDTTEQYLQAFPSAKVIGLEPDALNFAEACRRLEKWRNLSLLPFALSDRCGPATFRPVSHNGSHSLLEIEPRSPYFEFPVDSLAPVAVETVTLDQVCRQRSIETVDVLKMDIQGGELLALQGARSLLERGAVRVIALEVLFTPLYKAQPSFWDLADFLRSFGYALHGLYESQYHARNPAILRWADAIFVSPAMLAL